LTDYFLGVDIGGTKSDALIASQDGHIAGIGRAGCGNWESIGYEGMAGVLQKITRLALDEAGLQTGQIAAAGFGISGFDWPSQYDLHMEAVHSLGLTCPVGLVNDALVGLLAGTDAGWGVAVIAGTGNNCWGQDRHGRIGRVTGEGYLFDEEGGAGTLITEAIRAISRQWSKRGPHTLLAPAFLETKGLKNIVSLLEGLAHSHIGTGRRTYRVQSG
jgi:N-acetylglucosamine kinase-like BadF-type ATPase